MRAEVVRIYRTASMFLSLPTALCCTHLCMLLKGMLCYAQKFIPVFLNKHFPTDTQNPTLAIAGREAQDAELTSKVISNKFFGICIMPVSPSSPETQIQGFDVVITLLSFLMGIITVLYGITVIANNGNYTSV